jgi:phosphohistidine phosphatase
MTSRLLLLRHAKSDWSQSGLADRDRPLAKRGRDAAKVIAGYIRQQQLAPDRVLSSPATRTRQTVSVVLDIIGTSPKIVFDETLYDFGSGERLLAAIRNEGGDAATLMLVGHNPAIERLAALLAGTGDTALMAAMTRKFPTAALAVLDFETRAWSAVKPGKGTLTAFVTPKGLAAEPRTS